MTWTARLDKPLAFIYASLFSFTKWKQVLRKQNHLETIQISLEIFVFHQKFIQCPPILPFNRGTHIKQPVSPNHHPLSHSLCGIKVNNYITLFREILRKKENDLFPKREHGLSIRLNSGCFDPWLIALWDHKCPFFNVTTSDHKVGACYTHVSLRYFRHSGAQASHLVLRVPAVILDSTDAPSSV